MRIRYLLPILALGMLQACVTQKSYVDPQYRHASYNDLARVNPPYVLDVKVEFQRNGEDKPAVDRTVADRVSRSLRASGVAIPYDGHAPADGQLNVIANNVVSLSGAAAKGFGTGLTLGLVGSHVTDNYEVTVRLTQGAATIEREYPHSIITTVGNASGPAGVQPVAIGTAVDQVIDDVVLNFLKDMQAAGSLKPR